MLNQNDTKRESFWMVSCWGSSADESSLSG